MTPPDRTPSSRPFLSLRWQTVIALSFVLALVNASLAYLVYRQSVHQLELQRAEVHASQGRQLRALVHETSQQMSKLASLVPLLGPSPPLPDLGAQLRRALDTNGSMLDVEWDIRSVHWLDDQGRAVLAWPDSAPALPAEVPMRLRAEPEGTTAQLICDPECFQYLATPLLWEGGFRGSLVLARSLADSLLAFSALTGADVAIAAAGAKAGGDPAASPFAALTHPERTGAVLAEAARPPGLPDTGTRLATLGGSRFEVFRVDDLASGVNAYAINDVSAQHRDIRRATERSLLLGLLGLLASESLLLAVMGKPLQRLRRIAQALPLLAESRYGELLERLPAPRTTRLPADEMDRMVTTVVALTERMENMQRYREQAESRLVWLADHDPLTGLCNRRRFNEELVRIVDMAVRYGHTGAVLFFDLDRFKEVNDLSGHQVGDILLQQVGERLEQIVRPSDLIARLGGDEFALVLPAAGPEEAIAAAERCQGVIQKIELTERGRRYEVSASIGIVIFPERGADLQKLMADADLAMYQAKEQGGGRWHLFSDADQAREQVDARVQWREQIESALREDRFELHFQPIVEIASGRTNHLEALLRMRDLKGGIVYPDRFIPVAEKTGQIRSIDRWVLNHALELMGRQTDLKLAINLAASALQDPSLLPDLELLLDRFGVLPQRVSFEVTESAAIESLTHAKHLMSGIQRLGCRFALDDFGSGYASYAYLRELPVDQLKVDGAFVRNLAANREDRIFVKAIADMAHSMGKTVTAEYVENRATFEIVAELGVDYAQGFYCGRPEPLRTTV
jgi:diguanylate cyclase (GGDEF)-like protein